MDFIPSLVRLFSGLAPGSLGRPSASVFISLYRVLTECNETLTQETFPHRDRYTGYILLFLSYAEIYH